MDVFRSASCRLGRHVAVACTVMTCVSVSTAAAADAPLADAIRRGHTAAAAALLAKKADVNGALPDGTTALHWAVERDDVDLVTKVLAAGAKVNTASRFGVTPLSLACRNGNASIVNALIRAGADVSTPLPNGETPLMIAARTGRVEPVKRLLERGVDVNAKEPHAGQTAIMWAIAEGHAEVVETLIKAGGSVTEPSKRGFTPLLFAARNGDLATTKLLLGAGVQVNDASKDGTTALVIATIRSHVDYAKFLLDLGADPNKGPGFTPLHWIAGDWSSELAGEKTEVRPEGTEWDLLLPLQGKKRDDFIRLLVTKGADVNARAKTVPRSSVGSGGEGGGMFGARGARLAGATPFLMAAIHADVGLMKLLKELGADPLIRTERNLSPLMAAAGLDSGESIGYTGVKEKDALAAVQLCLEYGDSATTVSIDNENALHGVAYRGNAGGNTVADLLIAKGADVMLKNKRGWTPVTLAEGIYTQNSNSKNPDLERLLLAKGGKPSPPGIERDAYAVIKEPQQ